MEKMKAMVYTRYGSPEVLELREVEVPRPLDGEVLIRVHASSIAYGDLAAVKGEPFLVRFPLGLRKP